jgi:Uri superfamily endonuclease
MNPPCTSVVRSPRRADTPGSGIHLPSKPGTYALILHCDASTVRPVGALGPIEFNVGYYIYVGSALGPGGIRARVSRHLRKTGKLHWHVDYIRRHMPVHEIWYIEATMALEHAWARAIGDWTAARTPVRGFGASDCTCASHLFFCSARPQLEYIRERLGTGMAVKSVRPDHALP